MRKLLLLTAASAISLPMLADDTAMPKTFENTCAYSLAPNGQYIVSEGMNGMKIINVSTGQIDDYSVESDNGLYSPGIGKCVSNVGVIVGTSEADAAVYWKDGEWYMLEVPAEAVFSNHAQAITPDGNRICGTIGTAGINFDDDVLMQEPCVWNWNEESGDYDAPVILPHPDLDFTGRVPQYVTAIDISQDGKTIAGQVMTATGMYRYPIIYTENESGEWSYKLPDEKGLYPEGFTFPQYPGDAPIYPSYESYMSPEDLEAYVAATTAWSEAQDWNAPYPNYEDYMSAENLEAYNKAMEEYEIAYAEWYAKYEAWVDANSSIVDNNPYYEFNSIRISPDGKKYANTVQVKGEDDPMAWFAPTYSYIWVFDIETGEITKYEQKDDFTLTFLGDDGVALAVSNLRAVPCSYVLKDGEAFDMKTWIGNAVPDYNTWMEENLIFEVVEEVWNEELEDYEFVFNEALLTGRAYATPDLSQIVLGINNVWDYTDEGLSVLFNMDEGNGVVAVGNSDGDTSIFDLSGRKLRNADAPGVYIINGKKKVVR